MTRQVARGADPQGALHGRAVVGAREHELADRQAAVWLQVVEAVMQAECPRLLVQQSAGALPAQRCGAGHFGEELIAQRLQHGDPAVNWHTRIVGEGDVYAACGQLGRHARDSRRGRVHDHPYSRLCGLDLHERMNVQELRRDGGHLVGGHHPRAQAE